MTQTAQTAAEAFALYKNALDADADVDAYADADDWKLLADGMVDALNRVELAA